MQSHTHLTTVILVYYANNNFMGLFYESCTSFRQYWGKNQTHCELVTSQPRSQLDSFNFSIFNNFLVYHPICMKFAPNCLVLEILQFWLGFTVSDPFPLRLCDDTLF